MRTIGLISNTHGLAVAQQRASLIAQLRDAFRGVELILHLGDVGEPAMLEALATIAPVRAMRGDRDDRALPGLEPRIDEPFGPVHVVATHGHEVERADPPRLVSAYMHADVIVWGHSREPLITRAARRLVINPGSAGPDFLGPSPTVAKLYIKGRQSDAQLIALTGVGGGEVDDVSEEVIAP